MSMRRIVVPVVLALSGLGAVGTAPVECGESPLQVVTVAGHAEVQGPSSAWTGAKLRAELGPGGAARTLQGRLTLMTASGQEVRLAPLSRVSLLEDGAPDQPTRVRLDAGSVWAAVRPGGPAREQIEVQTAAVTVVVSGSGVEVSLGRDGSALVRVYHGAATCSGPGTERQWSRVLGDRQELFVPSAGQPGETRKLDRNKIDPGWVKWNEDQDLAGGYGSRPPDK
jgi:hypothetical protein